MQQAAQQLQQPNPANTQAAEANQGQAMNDLGKAELNLAAKADELKNQLGQPAGDPAAAQAAEAALNRFNKPWRK